MYFFQQKYVFSGQYERMERLPKLVEWLVSIGASLESIGAYPLHAVVQLCIKASKCEKEPPTKGYSKCGEFLSTGF